MGSPYTNGGSANDPYYFGTPVFAPGGYAANPMAFPGYANLYAGSYLTYRWMLQHPIMRLVRSIAVSPIVASKWEYKKIDKDVPDEWVQATRECFDLLRWNLLNDFFIRGRDMGWAGGEVIWDWNRNKTRESIVRVKPLLHDVTSILVDEFGNFTGLRNMVGKQVDIKGSFKAWKYTYDSEAGYVYGRSWLENTRATCWKDWLDAATQMQRLGAKISGTVTIITAPAGTFPGPDGKPISYRDNAHKAIEALAKGAAGIYFPSLSVSFDQKGNIDAMKVLAELAGKSLTNINPLDFGSQAPAIGGLLERMRHDEELMFAGGLRPARTGLEAKHGAKADAETHSDTGTTNAENDDNDFAMSCQPLVDAFNVINFGDQAKGAVCIRPPSLVYRKLELLKSILLGGVNTQEIARELFKTMDMDDLLEFLEIKTCKKFDPGELDPPEPPQNVGIGNDNLGQKPGAPAGSEPKGQQTNPEGGKPKEQ